MRSKKLDHIISYQRKKIISHKNVTKMKLSSFVILLYQTHIYTCLAFSPNLALRNLSSNNISRPNVWFDASKLSQRPIGQSSRFVTTELQSATKTAEDKKHAPIVVSGTASRVNAASANAILADRICIDFVQTLSPTEGCWIGSSTRVMALVLSEATETSFIPFRVNAGPIHSYVLLKDGLSSKCLSELEPGDEILMTDCLDGTSRSIAVGRVTVDAKPCNVINLRGCNSEDNAEESAQIFIEASESVRLGQVTGNFVRSTEIPSMDKDDSSCEILLRLSKVENHVVNGYRNKEPTLNDNVMHAAVDDVFIPGSNSSSKRKSRRKSRNKKTKTIPTISEEELAKLKNDVYLVAEEVKMESKPEEKHDDSEMLIHRVIMDNSGNAMRNTSPTHEDPEDTMWRSIFSTIRTVEQPAKPQRQNPAVQLNWNDMGP